MGTMRFDGDDTLWWGCCTMIEVMHWDAPKMGTMHGDGDNAL